MNPNQQPKDMISDHQYCVSALGKKGLATGTSKLREHCRGTGKEGERGLSPSCTFFFFLATQN